MGMKDKKMSDKSLIIAPEHVFFDACTTIREFFTKNSNIGVESLASLQGVITDQALNTLFTHFDAANRYSGNISGLHKFPHDVADLSDSLEALESSLTTIATKPALDGDVKSYVEADLRKITEMKSELDALSL